MSVAIETSDGGWKKMRQDCGFGGGGRFVEGKGKVRLCESGGTGMEGKRRPARERYETDDRKGREVHHSLVAIVSSLEGTSDVPHLKQEDIKVDSLIIASLIISSIVNHKQLSVRQQTNRTKQKEQRTLNLYAQHENKRTTYFLGSPFLVLPNFIRSP